MNIFSMINVIRVLISVFQRVQSNLAKEKDESFCIHLTKNSELLECKLILAMFAKKNPSSFVLVFIFLDSQPRKRKAVYTLLAQISFYSHKRSTDFLGNSLEK